MSKVICDVCGTTYPETSAQCPICGSAKTSASQTAAGAPDQKENVEVYAPVKGGRFSKKNVRKRNSRTPATSTAQRRGSNARPVQEKEEPNNTGLIIVIVLLLLAICATLGYIYVTRLAGREDPKQSDPPKNTDNTSQSDNSEPSGDPVELPCTGLELSNNTLELNVGDTWTLLTQLEPVDTTDTVSFESSDDAIAIVTQDGVITMVAEGEAVITVICGNQSAVCTVKTPVTVPPVLTFEFEWNTKWVDDDGIGDCTISSYNGTWKAYTSGLTVPVEDITWTSDDPSVAVIEKGIVTAKGHGTTRVHATYNGITYSCIIRCPFETPAVTGDCVISHTDVTIAIGETFTLKLRDKDGMNLEVTWTCNNDCVTIDGGKITGAVAGKCTVSTTYEGATYSCTIYVKAA